MGFLDDVKDLGYKKSTVEFPRVWYHNGNKHIAQASQWYTKAEESGDLPEPWTEVEKFEGETGYVAQQFRFAPILMRSQSFITDADGRTQWLDHYVKGARIYTEYLSFIEGFSQPAVFIVKGLAGKAISDHIKQFRKSMPNSATVPPWTFYIPLAVEHNKSGKPVFHDTGKGAFVNLPILGEYTQESAYVGKDLLNEGMSISTTYASWAKARRGDTPEPAEEEAKPESEDTSGQYDPF